MWKPIETLVPEVEIAKQYLLCNKEKKWIRFGRKFTGHNEWYYSGTNERSQYAELTNDDLPTHWQEIPELPE